MWSNPRKYQISTTELHVYSFARYVMFTFKTSARSMIGEEVRL